LEGVFIVIKARKTDAKYECHIRGKNCKQSYLTIM